MTDPVHILIARKDAKGLLELYKHQYHGGQVSMDEERRFLGAVAASVRTWNFSKNVEQLKPLACMLAGTPHRDAYRYICKRIAAVLRSVPTTMHCADWEHMGYAPAISDEEMEPDHVQEGTPEIVDLT